MENKITSKEAPTPAAPVASENEIPPVVIEAEPKPRLFSFDSLEKVKGVIAKIQGVAEKIQKTLERLDEKGKLKAKADVETAKAEVAAATAQYLQGHPEATDPKADGAAKKSALAFLNSETKFPLLPQDQQLAFLKGEPLRWKDADAKASAPPGTGGWKESRLRFSLALKLEARALEESGKTNEAAQFYHSASLFAPQDIGLHADAARLLKAHAQKTQDPALKKQQEDAAEKHLDAVADEMQAGRIEVLIGKGKLGEADKLAERIKGEFYIQLGAEQRKVLASSPKVQCRLLEVNVYQAEIADKQGKHEQAVDIYKRFLKFGDNLIEKHPGHAEAYLLRAKIHHGLGDYAGAMQDYQALAKVAPEEAGYVANYRQDLASLAKRHSAEWHLAEAMGDHGKATLYLAEEVKVREACGDAAGVKELSAKLEALSKEMSFEKLVAKAQELAGGAHLSPLNAQLKDMQAYVKFSAKDGGGYQLEFTEAFQKSGDAKKLEVLQKLHMEGFIALHQSLAAKETDPAKKNYYQGKALLLEGKLPAARLKLIAFKAQTEGAKDPELAKMRAESGLLLRQLTLAGLERLSGWAEAFGAQKKGSAVTTLYKHATQGGYEEANKLLVDKLIACLKAGKADTVEEALAVLQEQHRQDVEALRKHPVAGSGEKVSYLYEAPEGAAAQGLQFSDDAQVKKLFALYAKDPQDPQAAALKDPKAFPGSCFFRLEGGTLDLGVSSAGDTKYPPKIRVVIGKEGGVIRAEGGTYKFPPSKEERVVLFSSGRLDPGSLKRDLKTEGGQAGDYEAHAWSALEKSDFAKHNGEAKRLAGLIDHAANLKAADPDFHALFSLETQEGLEKIKDPEAGRAHMLEVAKQLRHRTGCYAVAAEILEGLFRSDFQAALSEIPADKIEKVKKETEAERPKVEKQVKADLAKLKEKHPEDYAKRFPSGAPSQAEIKGMVDQALAGKLSIKIRKMAFEKVDAKAEQGPLSDSVATQAWKVYDDMKDPTDKTWNLADESWDGIVDEVVVTAVTMPVTMGTGALVRGGLGGTSLALRWAAQGGGRALAVKTGVFLAGAAAEGFAMAALGPGDFELKNAGFNILMSIAFHGGGKAWGKAGAKLGLDEAALTALRAEGKSVAGKSAANFAGAMLTQTAVATTMGYAGALILHHGNPNTFWERFGGEALRMLAFHYGTHAFNMATGHALVESDAANQAKMKAARESYLKWVEQSLPKEEAAKRAVAYAKDLKLDLKTGEASYELKEADLEAKAPEQAKVKPAPAAEAPIAPKAEPKMPATPATAKAPVPKGLPPIVEAQVQKAKKLAALGVERGLVDKNAAERFPRELEAYLRLFMAEAERTLDAQRPSPEQQKKLIPELAKKNAEHFTRRFAEELGLKKEANFQKKLEGLLRESLEKVAAHHNERLPSFPLESSAAKPAPAKPKRADQAEIAAGLEQFSKGLQSKTEQWLAAKEKGGKAVSREAFLQQQCEAAFQLAERLGVAGDPAFRKGLAEMVVGLIRRAEAHAPAGAWLPDSMAAYAKKAPVEKPAAAKSESPKPASEAAPAKKSGGLDIDQVVVEVSLLAKEFSGDPVAFKKELARVLITGFHELQKWVAKDSPGALEIGERVQFVSEALAKKLAAHFGVAKDAAFAKKIEGMLRSQLKEALAGKAAGSDTIIRPPDFSEAKAPLQVDSLFPEAPAEKLPSRGEFLQGLEAGLGKLAEAAQGPMKKSLEKKAHEEGLFSGAFGGEAKAKSGPEVIARNLRKLSGGLKKRLLDFVYDKVQKFEASGKKELGALDKAKLAEEVIRFAEEFGLAHEPAFTESLKQLVSEGMAASAKGFSEPAPLAVPKPGPVAKQFSKLRRSFLDKLFEARGELEVPPDGKVGITKPRAFAVEPVKQASAKLDAVFSLLEDRMLERPSPEVAKAAEAIGRDVDALVKEDPAKVGPEFEGQVGAEKAAAVARLERLLRGLELNPDWAADHLAAEYGKPFAGQAELEAAYARSAEAAHGDRYGELLADVCSRRDAKVPPFYQLAKLTLEEISRHSVGSEEFRDFLDRYAMVRDLEIEKSGKAKAAEAPKLPGFFDDIPLAAHGSPLGKSGHSSPDTLAPDTVQTPPPSLSGVKAKGPAPESISLDWAANDTMASTAKPKSAGILAPLPEAVPESTWAPAPAEASLVPDGSVAGIANPARKAEIAKAWVAAYENPKSPLHGDAEYQASYQAAKAYLSAVESGKAPPEAGFVADYHVTAKDGKGSGVLAFADPSQPPEKTWEVAGEDGQGRWQLKNLKTGETRSFQVLFQDKPAFLKGDRLRFLPMVAGASDGPLRPLRPAGDGQALWIGRDPSQSNVVVSEDFVSRLHCSIERAPEGWYVADRHSRNGVYVNGAKVEGSAWLKPGDVLSTKDIHGQFHLLGVFEPPIAAAAPAPKVPAKPSGNAGLFGEAAPILHGDVDLKAPPVHRLKPDAGSGEVAAVTTQGAGYGKKNEDNVLVMRGKGGLLMLDVDGMGGEGHGDVAALLTAEAFKAEMHRSGDEGQAWALANKTVRRFNAELHHLTGGKAKWAKPEQVQQALAAARAGILDPAAPLPEQGGAGAVAVAVRVHPPKHPGEAHRAEFSWVGDARAMILERGSDGKWHWVFRTVDEGLPSVPGMLRPGEDYEFGGARKTLAGALHPMANVVTNSVGKEGAVAVKKTSDGEFPAPGTATGAKEAGKGYEAGVALKPGQMILAGSDGFWENFGSTREVLDLIQFCKTAEQAREVLTHEAHRRMELLAEARAWLGNPAANPMRLERYPFEHHGKKQYIDAKGRVFDAPTGGKAVNHFKTDNFSLIAYLHNPAAEAASAAAPAEPLPAAAHAKAGPHPVKMLPMVPGNIPGLRRLDHAWIYVMPKNAAEVVIGRDAFPVSQETAGVSSKHVRLIRSVGSVFVQDMGSRNGMKVLRDGKEAFAWKSHDRTPGPTFAVHPGDQIVMGGTAVQFFGSE